MKFSVFVALLAVGGVAAYSTPSRRDIRSLGSKSFAPAPSRKVGSSMKMEGEFVIEKCLALLGPRTFVVETMAQLRVGCAHRLFVI
jgi:hypothetical protein